MSLEVEPGADCGLEYSCQRRDCPTHIVIQFRIEHEWVTTQPTNCFDLVQRGSGCNYKIVRIWHPHNRVLPRNLLNNELMLVRVTFDPVTLTPYDISDAKRCH